MKVFISADLEGISGVVAMDDVIAGKPGYAAACKAMTLDVNAAVQGALEGGAEEVVVFDAHAGGRNIDLELLHPAAEVIRGQPRPAMVTGLDDSFAAALLVGYHAMIGTAEAVMDHTMTSRFFRVRINGRALGEAGLAAAYAGHFGVPVALATGDDKLAREVSALLPGAERVVVKAGMGRTSARCLPLVRARELICQAAERAVRGAADIAPLTLKPPLELAVEFAMTSSADQAAGVPGLERCDDRTVTCTLQDMPGVCKLIGVLGHLAG